MEDQPRLPLNPSCDYCERALFGSSGVVCGVDGEPVWNVREVADGCPDWDPVPWAYGE